MDTGHRLRVGPLHLWLVRAVGEWRVSHLADPKAPDDASSRALEGQPPASATTRRYALAGTSPELRITPRTADRPTVIRPLKPLTVLAGQEVHLFCSVALWVELAADALVLDRVATQRPSDTWFGPDTRAGELCYASETAARLAVEHLPRAAYRAFARITLRNRSDAPMPIERIMVPVTGLPLFADVNAQLWLPALSLVRDDALGDASLTVGKRPPAHAVDAAPVSTEHPPPRRSKLVRALGAFWR
jgi:hypothetical protein